jgi:hypothetical protein
MAKRREREKQFTSSSSFAIFSFAQDLVTSAFLLLRAAFSEGVEKSIKESCGHYSVHAPASIVLICTAFDQWLNQSALTLDVRYKGLRESAAKMSTLNKYHRFTELVSGHSLEKDRELDMAWDVRNEIVHWLPRLASSPSNWPTWLEELQDRGLVLKSELPGHGDATDLASKLHSYLLARWVLQTIANSVERLLDLFTEEDEIEKGMIDWTASAF